jgi:folate-dependent phosphoribosylglycinamide formyltransferase PurN
MRFGLTVGGKFQGHTRNVYTSLLANNLKPNFILYCFPDSKNINRYIFRGILNRYPLIAFFIKKAYQITPIFILAILYKIWFPYIKSIKSKVYYVKGINSNKALEILLNEQPDVVIVLGCGIVGRRLCEIFHNKLLNAHAGKLPEFRGVDNVEWANFEGVEVIGTIHYIATGVDSGDIVYEQKLKNLENPQSVDEMREYAFSQVFSLFPKALETISKEPIIFKQTKQRTTRYIMHPYLKDILKNKLKVEQ